MLSFTNESYQWFRPGLADPDMEERGSERGLNQLLLYCAKYSIVVYTCFRSCLYLLEVQGRCPGHTLELSGLSVCDSKLAVFVSC